MLDVLVEIESIRDMPNAIPYLLNILCLLNSLSMFLIPQYISLKSHPLDLTKIRILYNILPHHQWDKRIGDLYPLRYKGT
jgi:hypothetical protein